jgi:hypothetical protein
MYLRNEKAFDDLSESDELKDILDGIQSSIKKQVFYFYADF